MGFDKYRVQLQPAHTDFRNLFVLPPSPSDCESAQGSCTVCVARWGWGGGCTKARTRVTMLSTNVAKRNGVAKDALASASTHFSTQRTNGGARSAGRPRLGPLATTRRAPLHTSSGRRHRQARCATRELAGAWREASRVAIRANLPRSVAVAPPTSRKMNRRRNSSCSAGNHSATQLFPSSLSVPPVTRGPPMCPPRARGVARSTRSRAEEAPRRRDRAGKGEADRVNHAPPPAQRSALHSCKAAAAAGGFAAWQGERCGVAVRGDKALFRGLWKLLGSASVAWILLCCALIGHLSRTHTHSAS
jgi:hypothetical protein